MREIKVRAWNGVKMSRSFTIDNICYEGPPPCVCDDLYGEYEPDAYVVWLQFTGLKDKNGKEICEGDIISSPHFKDRANRQHILKHIIQWSDKFHGWFLLNSGSMSPDSGSIQLFVADSKIIEIIGNIYENPELLEEQV